MNSSETAGTILILALFWHGPKLEVDDIPHPVLFQVSHRIERFNAESARLAANGSIGQLQVSAVFKG